MVESCSVKFVGTQAQIVKLRTNKREKDSSKEVSAKWDRMRKDKTEVNSDDAFKN